LTLPLASDAVVMLGGALITTVYAWDPDSSKVDAVTVNSNLPMVVGVPLMTALDASSDSPVGSAPAVTDQLQPIRIRQPLAVSVWEYAMFTVQGGSAAGLIVIAACALAVKYNNIAAATGQRPCLDFIVPPDFCCRSDRTAEQRQCAARQHPVKKPPGWLLSRKSGLTLKWLKVVLAWLLSFLALCDERVPHPMRSAELHSRCDRDSPLYPPTDSV